MALSLKEYIERQSCAVALHVRFDKTRLFILNTASNCVRVYQLASKKQHSFMNQIEYKGRLYDYSGTMVLKDFYLGIIPGLDALPPEKKAEHDLILTLNSRYLQESYRGNLPPGITEEKRKRFFETRERQQALEKLLSLEVEKDEDNTQPNL